MSPLSPSRCVLVTRPEPQASEWVEALSALGRRGFALPLLEVLPLSEAGEVARVQQVREAIAQFDLLVFVSPSAVQHFWSRPIAGQAGFIGHWPEGLRVAAPGAGTAQALRALGAPSERIFSPADDAPTQDSEGLWQSMQALDWSGKRVGVVRGAEGGRDWLGQRLSAEGARVESIAAYRRRAASWTQAQRAQASLALSHPDRWIWLLSSSEAIEHLGQMPGVSQDGVSRAAALATHPRIADTARRIGFGRVWTCAPTVPAVEEALRRIDAL